MKFMKKKRISSLDWLMFIIVAMFLVDLDFQNMRATEWVTFIACMLWLVLFILRQILTKERDEHAKK